MHADFVDIQLRAYVRLREALGFQMRVEKVLLPEFVAFLKAHYTTGPIRAHMALEWACQPAAHRGASGAARRLSMARGFLRYLKASVPDTEVPSPGLLPTPRRSTPFLFTPTQITALCAGAQASRPQGSVRPHTLSCLLGLLASTGLRVGEALRLHIDQVKLALDPPQLHILDTKFYKSRIVPVHPSTAAHLRHYLDQRAQVHAKAVSEAFLVSTRGEPLTYLALRNWFARLCHRVAIVPTSGGRAPCLTSFRHTFAVTCMKRWYQQGLDVQALLPHLSIYLGHVSPQESYWYLTAVPELLSAAAQRFETYAHVGGNSYAE